MTSKPKNLNCSHLQLPLNIFSESPHHQLPAGKHTLMHDTQTSNLCYPMNRNSMQVNYRVTRIEGQILLKSEAAMTFNTDPLSWSQPIYSLRKDRGSKLALSEYLHFYKVPSRAICTPFPILFWFYHGLKKKQSLNKKYCQKHF